MSNFIDLINYHISGEDPMPTNLGFINCAESIKDYFDANGYFPESIKKVDELPDVGESGKVYYNNTDGKYYIYNNNEFSEFGRSDIILVQELPDASEGREGAIYYDTTNGKYYLFDGADFIEIGTNLMPIRRKTGLSRPNNYGIEIEPNCYNILTIPADTYYLDTYSGSLTRPFVFSFINVPTGNFTALYVGRFTATEDNLAITLYSDNPDVNIHWTDNVPDIEANHVYEFNVLYDTCLLTDITTTSQELSTDPEVPGPTINP